MLKSEQSVCAALGIAGITLLPLLTAFFSLSFFLLSFSSHPVSGFGNTCAEKCLLVSMGGRAEYRSKDPHRW